MDCPVCKNAMITLELADVETDYCTGCGGVWLDAGELELLLGNTHRARQLLSSFRVEKKCRETKRRCPICLKRMEKIIVSISEPAVLIDRCAGNDGLWFDRGELKQVLRAGCFDEEDKVVTLLNDMFGPQKQ